VDEMSLGDALHAILAAEFVNPAHNGRADAIRRILRGYDLSEKLACEDIITMVERFHHSVEQQFRPIRLFAEVPIISGNEVGQRSAGIIDLLLETKDGWILIDHKSFPGKRSEWEAEAASYSGQLARYTDALHQCGLKVHSAWIHFAVGGGMVELAKT
jgi:ATP-dependent exoDNAse (exonuclease V) beta subunit